MNLKLVYETAFGDKQPFDKRTKNAGEFLFATMICDVLDSALDNTDEVTFVELYMYLLSKTKIDLNDVENFLIQNYANKSDWKNLDQFLYFNFNNASLFDVINKTRELSPALAEILIGDSDAKFHDIKDFGFPYSRLFLFMADKNVLRIKGKGEKEINNLVDGVYNLARIQQDYPIFVENFIKKEKIKTKDIKETVAKMLDTCNSHRVARARMLMEQNPKTKMVNETRIRVAKQSEVKQGKGWQNVKGLSSLVVGQEAATKRIADKIISSFVGFKSNKEPVATFLLTGPTGVGKTETAKAVANLCCDGNIFVVDMATFKHEADVSRLLGASPGYVGYGDRNSFCDFLNEHPNGVLLFDEIEKAARGCLDLLMRILDEGEFIDARGRTISLRESVIFCTTNLTEYLENSDRSVEEKMTSQEGLRKEIVGRFSEVIEYKKLSHDCCRDIVERFIEDKLTNFNAKNQSANITVSYTMSLVDKIIDDANTDLLGARDLKKTIQKYFITPISDYMLEHEPSNVNLIVTPDSIIEGNGHEQGLITNDTIDIN